MYKLNLPVSAFVLSICMTCAHAARPAQADTIAGTYSVEAWNTCLYALQPMPGVPAFTTVTEANGLQQLKSSVASGSSLTSLYYTLIVNPRKGTMVATDIVATRLDQNHSAGLVWQRTKRTSYTTFSVDKATDTLATTSSNSQWTQPDGSISVLTSSGGLRYKTIDNGDTFTLLPSDSPINIEQVITYPNFVYRYSTVCSGPLKAQRISRDY